LVMHKQNIPEEKLVNMAAAAAGLLPPEIYNKGKDHYHNGRVKFAKEFGPRIYATVSDGKMYTVTININDFSQSACTCLQRHACEHIAAVFLYYYDPWLRVNEMLSGLNHSVDDQTKTARPPFQLENPDPPVAVSVTRLNHPGAGRAGQPKNPGLAVPAPTPSVEGPVELWYEYFEHEYVRLRKAQKDPWQPSINYFFDKMYFLAMSFELFTERVAVPGDDWPSPGKDLYRLHSILFFMTRMEKQMAGAIPLPQDSYQRDIIEKNFIKTLGQNLPYRERAESGPFFLKAMEVVRERLFQEINSIFDWLLFYRFMCVFFSENSAWREKETVFLEEQMRKFEKNQRGYYCAALGLASLKMAAREEEQALAVLRELQEIRLDDMLFYLEYLSGVENWEKLLALLRWLAPGVKEARAAVLDDICAYCVQAAENSGAGEAFIGLVRSWLPRSFDAYADYLLESDLYREWVELNMTYREYTWENMDRHLLRHVESKDPAALIPLYHQWTAGLIEGKNRKSYQQAVKLLKKLRTLYNRQKMNSEWRTFISRLASHHQRLRAFQEELRKGKLIS